MIRVRLRSDAGAAYPLAVALALSLLLLFAALANYLRLLIIVQGVQDALQDAVIVTVTENYNEVYHSIREGYSGGYEPFAGGFNVAFDYGDIYKQLDQTLGLTATGGKHVKLTDGRPTFSLSGLSVTIENAPLASGDIEAKRFKVYSEVMLEIPLAFGFDFLLPVRLKAASTAGFTPKF